MIRADYFVLILWVYVESQSVKISCGSGVRSKEMESKEATSSVIEKSMCFNGLFQPLHQEKLRVIEKQNQPKGFIQKYSSKSNSGFKVVPTKELCRVYLQKPSVLASKGIIDAQSTPPHRKFRRRYDQQHLKSKLRHQHTSDDPLKPKIGKKANSLRYFTPLGFSSGSHLGDRKESKEIKKLCDCTTTLGQKKDRAVRQVGSKLMVSTSRDSVRTCNDKAVEHVKFRHVCSSGLVSKDINGDSLDYSNASPGCQTNSEEAHQPSPVSVLEPFFDEDVLDDREEIPHLDIQENQLEALNFESESYSDGSGMEVSSDEESVLDSETEESKDSEPIGIFDSQESRDSFYIDDTLAEVVLGDKNWVCDKRDIVIATKIFEKMEKKYYTETSWKRSERRILFDRIISGLVEIVESFSATPTWKNPVSRRLGTTLSTCGLKQELWKVLARQEKRAKKESVAKMPVIDIDKWSELEADDESVVCELENMIMDELLAEVVSFM